MIVPIANPADPRVAPYLVVRERDLVGRRGEFIAEGEVVLNVLLGNESRCSASSLLVAENRIGRLMAVIKRLDASVPVYVASPSVMDAVVGFHIHRGMLAHGRCPPDPGPAALLAGLPHRALIVALFGIANHDNLGGVFRNAAAFGADAVLLDSACCDPFYRKAIRVSVGATLRTPFARLGPTDDALELLGRAGFEALALAPDAREPLARIVRPERVAVLLGPEGPGLPPDILGRARTVGIAMAAGWDSLNIAATSAIALHELTRKSQPLAS